MKILFDSIPKAPVSTILPTWYNVKFTLVPNLALNQGYTLLFIVYVCVFHISCLCPELILFHEGHKLNAK